MSEQPDPRRWKILSVSLLVGFMSLLDVTIVNVAIPSIRAGLDTSAGAVQWVVSGYALAFGLTLVAGGRLGDAHGRRALMTWGLVGFVVSSAAVGLATNATWIVVAAKGLPVAFDNCALAPACTASRPPAARERGMKRVSMPKILSGSDALRRRPARAPARQGRAARRGEPRSSRASA